MWSNRTRSTKRQSTSARGEERPERLGAALGDRPAQQGRPLALAAELGAPRPEPARDELELVLVGEADRAVDLVRDRGADTRGLTHAHLRHRGLEPAIAAVGGAERVRRRDPGRRRLAREQREVLLDRLELSDGLPDLPPLR